MRQSEHDMKIIHFQQFFLPCREPAFSCLRLTLGAVPIATGNGDVSITCLMGSICKWRVNDSLSLLYQRVAL